MRLPSALHGLATPSRARPGTGITRMRLWFSIASALGAALVGSVAAAQPITLKFSHFLGPRSFFQLDVVEPWARELEARTNGQVKVETFDADSPFGKPAEQASQVKSSTVDIALGLRGA